MGLISWWRRLRMRRYVRGLKVIPPQQLVDDDVDSLAPTQLVHLHVAPPKRDLEKTRAVELPRTRRDIPIAPAIPPEDDGLGLLDQLTMTAPLGYTEFAESAHREPKHVDHHCDPGHGDDPDSESEN